MATGKPRPTPDGAPRSWADIDAALKAGNVPDVPPGVDLDEFIWQMFPDARLEIEARNPGRRFLLTRIHDSR